MRNKSVVQPGETHKWCSRCETERSLEEFHKNRARPDGLQNYCKACSYSAHRESLLKARGKSGENGRRWQKNRRLKEKYGITLADFELLVLEQNNKCAICHLEMDAPEPDVDETKQLRALLCGSCKTGLTRFRDSQELLFRAISYLDAYSDTKGRVSAAPRV